MLVRQRTSSIDASPRPRFAVCSSPAQGTWAHMFRTLFKRALEWELLKFVFRSGKARGRSQARRWRYQ
jgi:hypothetical protein